MRLFTSPIRQLPDFLIIGAQRCGTTSLYRYLVKHPNVAPASKKEVHFFDTEAYARGVPGYRAHFPTSAYKNYVRRARGAELVSGEASPYYLFYPLAPERARETVPEAKLVVLLRNPIDRAYSHYNHNVRSGRETLPFEEAIECEGKRLAGERERMIRDGKYRSRNHRTYSYLSRGIYVDQLRHWRDFFPEEQFLVLMSEDLYADPSAVVERSLDFLDLPAVEHRRYKKHNEGNYPEMNAATRRYLFDYFRPHNDRLYDYLGRDFDWKR